MSLKQSREISQGKTVLKAGKQLTCRGHYRVRLDKEKEVAVVRTASVLFAKANWRKAKDIAQERRETVFFLFLFLFFQKDSKKFVEVGTKL